MTLGKAHFAGKGTASGKETSGAIRRSFAEWASGAAALASRHLRPNPGSDVAARQLEYRAHVSVSTGESGGFLSLSAGAKAGRGRDGSTVCDSADRSGTSAPLRLSPDLGGAAATGNAGEPHAVIAWRFHLQEDLRWNSMWAWTSPKRKQRSV